MATRVNTWPQQVTRKVNVIDIGRDWPNPAPPLLVPNYLLKLNIKDNLTSTENFPIKV